MSVHWKLGLSRMITLFIVVLALSSPIVVLALSPVGYDRGVENHFSVVDIGHAEATLCQTQTQIPQTECEALLTFYNGTNGPNWSDTPDNNWTVTDTPCGWRGVTCQNGHVTKLDRYEKNLVGPLPNLSAFGSLENLRLPNNRLSGDIPDPLPSTLTDLSLGNNQLTGTIPDPLPTGLTRLGLYNSQPPGEWFNQLEGALPDPLPAGLVYLSVAGNQLTGQIPNPLPGSLLSLSLSRNQLHGPIPDPLPPGLEHLSLSSNPLGGPIPTDLPASLREMYVSSAQLSGPIPAVLPVGLKHVDLQYNQLSGPIPTSLPANLERLSLYSNQLNGPIPADLPVGLKDLFLSANQLSGLIPAALPTGLERLTLSANQLSGPIPADLPVGLTHLRLDRNQLDGDIPSTICSLTLNTSLDYNKLTGGDACAGDTDWANTQTVPPTNVQAAMLSTSQMKLTWDVIPYTSNGGYYEVRCADTPGGPYSSEGTTEVTGGKRATEFIVSNLPVGMVHYCVVNTFTPAHGSQENPFTYQQNSLTSIDSLEVSSMVADTQDLTVIKTGDGQGNVAGDPPGIECGDICTYSYTQGMTVTLTALASVGANFEGWSGDCDEAGQVVMDADRSCTAMFDKAEAPARNMFLPLLSTE